MSKRILVAPCRSGSTALQHSLDQHPDIDTFGWSMKLGLDRCGEVDYSFYEKESKATRYQIYRATMGYAQPEHSRYSPFRSEADIRETRPLFMLRDPLQAANSWYTKGWLDGTGLENFISAYEHTRSLFLQAREVSEYAQCVTYEGLTPQDFSEQQQVFQAVCSKWGIPYDDVMILWSRNLGEGYTDELTKQRITLGIVNGVHHNLLSGGKRFRRQENALVLPNEMQARVKGELEESYAFFRDNMVKP